MSNDGIFYSYTVAGVGKPHDGREVLMRHLGTDGPNPNLVGPIAMRMTDCGGLVVAPENDDTALKYLRGKQAALVTV